MAVSILVPVKRFSKAKARLASVLSAAQRAALAEVMLCDVLQALRGVPAEVAVISADPRALQHASQAGFAAIAEPVDAGLNAALIDARDSIHARPFAGRDGQVRRDTSALIVVPADLPLLTAACIEDAMAALADPNTAVLAPALVDGGTNLFGCNPAARLEPVFGPASFRRHWEQAQSAGLAPLRLDRAALRHDIDRPDDLTAFMASPSPTATYALLESFGFAPAEALL